MQLKRLWAVVMPAAAVIAALTIAACGGSAGSASSGSFGSGASSHALQGTTVSGGSYELTTTSGKPTVVNFFASWCGPCNNEAGDLAAFAAAHPDVQMVGVAVNDQRPDARAFLIKYGLHYPVVMDPNGSIAADWGVNGIPHTFFLDRSGKQQASIVGSATQAQFEQDLKTIQ
jgi:cytochrome c biogenesis protein CcmG/thiol:disulfide interchange protein DsbE